MHVNLVGMAGWVVLFLLVLLLGSVLVNARTRRGIAGPWDISIVNLITVMVNMHRLLDWMVDCTHRYGMTWSIVLPMQGRFIVVADPKNVQHILKSNFDNYVKGPDFSDITREFLGNGIFATDGAAWLPQRKTMSHLFKLSNFKDRMIPVFTSHGQRVVDMMLGHAADVGSVFDAQSLFYRYTLDSIGVIAFGVDIDSLSKPDTPFAKAFDFVQWAVMMRGFTPLWFVWRALRCSPVENRIRRDTALINEFVRQSMLAATHSDDDTLVSLFRAHGREALDGDAAPENDEFIRDLIVNTLFAGRDTTGAALSWLFYELASNAAVEARLIGEIDSVLNGSAPAHDDLRNLPYLHACVSETLRLHPSVPRDLKAAVHDDVLPDGTRVAAGCWLVYVPYVMGRLTQIWGPDATTFRPERWLDMTERPDHFTFLAFNAGPRLCLGERMAYIEIMTLTVLVLQRLTLRLAPGAVVRPQNQITLAIEGGLPMIATARS